MATTLELGAQSYCFRHFKENRDVAARLRACGLSQIEVCDVHVDFQDVREHQKVIEIYRDAGVSISSVGVCQMTNQPKIDRNVFEFAKAAGARLIAVDFDIDSLPACFETADNFAEQYGVQLGIHNHGGQHWLGSAQAIDYVLNRTSQRVGLCLDTAWAMHSHEDPIAMIGRFAGRIFGVHIKDFTFDSAGQHTDVIVGSGNLDLPRLLAALDTVKFDGPMTIEYEGDIENPVPAITQCVAAVQEAAGYRKRYELNL